MHRLAYLALVAGAVITMTGCQSEKKTQQNRATLVASNKHDIHSFGEPEKVRVRDVALDLTVSFEKKTLSGTVILRVEQSSKLPRASLTLDTRDLQIEAVEDSPDNTSFAPAKFQLGPKDAVLGSALTIELKPDAKYVRIRYATSPNASGLQWLNPSQTAGKKQPFLFSQSQSIHARSWIPLQDSPGARVTYSAKIHTPKNLVALMSAEHKSKQPGLYEFALDKAIPPYLIALAVGDLKFQATGPRTGVYAEPSVLPAAAREFSDMEKMVETTEKLYGPYRWGRYDLLVLPPSFPFGGMENPLLTFATPTVIAGDKSLVGLVSHELAHSWSGNLVTNATWSDFWLNEGFTSYIENRIQEAVYGREQALMEQVLAKRGLDQELKEFKPRDQILHIDLSGRDPDDGTTQVPYIKGALFLRSLEEAYGRETFDAFLKKYFDHFAFQSITTEEALAYLKKELLDTKPEIASKIPVQEWVYQAGLPATAPKATSTKLEKVGAAAQEWTSGKIAVSGIPAETWSTQEWLEFLKVLPSPLGADKMAALDKAFHLTKTGNSEILDQWLLMAIQSDYSAAYPKLEEFLTHVGRQKFIKPLYVELMKTPAGQARARTIYAKARSGYHPIAQTLIDKVVK